MKPKTCKNKECKAKFTPRFSTTEQVCSVKCAIAKTRQDKERKALKQEQQERRELRERKERLKTRSDYEREAQQACNAYIRERDKGENCISCGRVPKKRNAGHFLSVGAHPELRYSPLNIHLQCEHCNSYKSGNIADYRPRLIEKIGEANVLWLEGPHKPQNRTIEDLKEIKAWYKQQTKILKQG